MNFNFGEILTRAWRITWKYKILWIFGILASCTQGNGGGSGGGGNSGFHTGPSDGNLPPELQRFAYQMESFGEWMLDNWWIFIVIGLVVLLIATVAIFLGTIGRIGLIKGAYKADQEEPEKLVFGELFSTSMPYFWKVFGLSFLIGLAFLLLFVPFGIFGVLTAGVGFLCLLPLICILIPVGWLVSVLIEQANRAIVLEDMGIQDALKRGWEIVKANVGPMLVMSLILFGISLVLGIIIALPVLIVVIPAAIGFIAGGARNMTPLYTAIACVCAYMPVSLVANGILITFTQSSWTLTYLQLTKKPEFPESPILVEADA